MVSPPLTLMGVPGVAGICVIAPAAVILGLVGAGVEAPAGTTLTTE